MLNLMINKMGFIAVGVILMLIVTLSQSHYVEVTKQKQSHELMRDIIYLMRKLNQLQDKHHEGMKDMESKINKLKMENQKEVNKMRIKHDDDMNNMQNALNRQQKQHEKDIGELHVCTCRKNTEVVCPSKLPVKWRGHCYGLINLRLTYQKAQSYCQSLNGNLVWIEDNAEQKFLEHTYKNTRNSTWIGCNDKAVEGKFVLIHNNQPVTFSNWFPGEPNNGKGGNEDCCEVNRQRFGTWNDVSCHVTNEYFICKK